jgi:hypothetical protein
MRGSLPKAVCAALLVSFALEIFGAPTRPKTELELYGMVHPRAPPIIKGPKEDGLPPPGGAAGEPSGSRPATLPDGTPSGSGTGSTGPLGGATPWGSGGGSRQPGEGNVPPPAANPPEAPPAALPAAPHPVAAPPPVAPPARPPVEPPAAPPAAVPGGSRPAQQSRPGDATGDPDAPVAGPANEALLTPAQKGERNFNQLIETRRPTTVGDDTAIVQAYAQKSRDFYSKAPAKPYNSLSADERPSFLNDEHHAQDFLASKGIKFDGPDAAGIQRVQVYGKPGLREDEMGTEDLKPMFEAYVHKDKGCK